MAYASWSVVFGEQPSTSKWNILGTNDASFNDGTGIGSAAIGVSQLKTEVLPSGLIMPYAGATAPTYWLICDGTAVSRTTYANLFALVSTTYGAGNGTTTFNLPDLQNRVPVGKGTGTFATLGSTGGVETVNLSHSHTVNAHSHPGNTYTTGINNSNHTHSGIARGVSASDGMSSDHTHNYTVTDGASAPGTSASLTTTSLLQPYQVTNYIIKT